MGIRQNLDKRIPGIVMGSAKTNALLTRSNGEMLLASCVGAGVGFLAQHFFAKRLQATQAKQHFFTKRPAPPEVEWKDAMVWSVASGALVGVSKLLLERGLATQEGQKLLSLISK